jgi:uncharacterized membrane protein YeaQ/YmgE (transglycosylase-associated protein family)
MEESLPLIIQLLSGAIGGNVAGKLFSNLNLGTVGNSISGILGGGIGGWVLGLVGLGDGGTGLSGILGSVAAGAIGGAVIMAIVGALKKAFVK